LEDKDGNDINAKASYNFLNIQTRLRGDIKGPDALGAKTSGAIEAEFFGTTDTDMNGFRLRHAYVKLNWKTTELMVGQFWHPMFITSCYPDVVHSTQAPRSWYSPVILKSAHAGFQGIPCHSYSPSPRLIFKSPGPEGTNPGANSKYIRNSAIPSLT